ncbi:CDP-glucose 4,6-dehydratase [Fodinisporobacter ferrooxydans]|uniref:CDP-glucose 4,6-dehydratase n=1 Tax=Fodinisporobacter ferrooxydans TaxID=2901836 RepID=A0ABY4CEV1_9BACL|nr:CDP-glucose 4,6-dehydratase [Alicyclobacillaceae bacterium MYW30-H2]
MLDVDFWKNKNVLVTGHTGFKGSWLCLWLHALGAKVTGYALSPPSRPNVFQLCEIGDLVTSVIDDIRNKQRLQAIVSEKSPEIIIHLAAQPLVQESYHDPAETYEINAMGTVYLFEAIRHSAREGKGAKAVVNVTSDKCYKDQEWIWGYRENDPLGGFDPYSNSKACSELITASYRNSFFHHDDFAVHGVALASARAGNVIGGGDFAALRLVPDCMRSLLKHEPITIRNPAAVRPWQHVLEPLGGYLMLAQKLYECGTQFAEEWNFGPNDNDARTVEWVVGKICEKWGSDAIYEIDQNQHPHETHYLTLDCSKAKTKLGWHPVWNLEQAIDKVIEWTRAYRENHNIRHVCLKQMEDYMNCFDQ